MEERISGRVRRFLQLPFSIQCAVIVGLAVLGTDSLTLVFYWIFFHDRLLLDLFLSTLIAVIVGYPLAYIFLRQSGRLMVLADEMERISRIDDLTQLLNRRTFFSTARKQIANFAENESAGALLFADVDHFKSLNDTWGHLAGDEVLRQLGTVFRSCVRQGDITGRLGGEEFAVFLSSGDKEAARRVSEKIRNEISAIPARLGLDGWRLTVSIGVVVHRKGQDLEDLLRSADGSLYAAKFQGRDRTVYYEESNLAA